MPVQKYQVTSKIVSARRLCDECHTTIDESNWCLYVKIEGEKGMHIIHDNEGVCLERLLVRLGLTKPTILSSFGVSTR